MANAFLNAQEYANVMLLLLKNQLTMGRLVNGQFRDQVTDENGLSISVKRPPRFIAKSGAALAAQDIVTGSEVISVDQYKNVHISVGDLEYVQSYNELMRNQTMLSAASELAHDVDKFLTGKFLDFFSWIGSPGTAVNSPAAFFPAHTRLMEQSAPNQDINGVLAFADAEGIRASLVNGDIDGVNRTALERARIPLMSEIDSYATQQLTTLTTGDRTNGAVAGANQNVNYRDVKDNARMSQTLDIDGLGANATISAGEVFTIAGVQALNPRTREVVEPARLQQFTVLEDATANGSGAATVTISPAIIVTGTNDGVSTDANTAFGVVDAAPADNAVVTWLGSAETSYQQRGVFQRQAISLVSARLHTPFTGESSFATDPETGISIRYWRGSDIATGAHIHRWDMIYGGEVMDNFLGTRINGPGT
jgi:hypothetical protein